MTEWTEKPSFNRGNGHIRDFAKAWLSLRDKQREEIFSIRCTRALGEGWIDRQTSVPWGQKECQARSERDPIGPRM